MGLDCLHGLITSEYPPEFVVIHKDYELEKLFDVFYEPMEKLCSAYDIPLIKTGKISELKNNFSGFKFGICSGFMEIIGKEILDIPEMGIFNLHCGKLPFYRGRAPISRTIIDGNKFLTMTLHKMDEGVDSGDILTEYEIEIKNSDDVNTVYKKCCEVSSALVIKGIKKIDTEENTNNIFTKQNLTLKPKPNRKISEEERRINWNANIDTIQNLIRAITYPYPCAFSTIKGTKYLFIKSEIIRTHDTNTKKSGEIILVSNENILINCLNGILSINCLQLEDFTSIKFEKEFKNGDVFE